MATSGQPNRSILSNIIKVLIFIAAVYIAYKILKPLLIVLLGISFWIVKVVVFVAVAIIIIHLFLKLIFGIDLFQRIGIRNWWK